MNSDDTTFRFSNLRRAHSHFCTCTHTCTHSPYLSQPWSSLLSAVHCPGSWKLIQQQWRSVYSPVTEHRCRPATCNRLGRSNIWYILWATGVLFYFLLRTVTTVYVGRPQEVCERSAITVERHSVAGLQTDLSKALTAQPVSCNDATQSVQVLQSDGMPQSRLEQISILSTMSSPRIRLWMRCQVMLVSECFQTHLSLFTKVWNMSSTLPAQGWPFPSENLPVC